MKRTFFCLAVLLGGLSSGFWCTQPVRGEQTDEVVQAADQDGGCPYSTEHPCDPRFDPTYDESYTAALQLEPQETPSDQPAESYEAEAYYYAADDCAGTCPAWDEGGYADCQDYPAATDATADKVAQPAAVAGVGESYEYYDYYDSYESYECYDPYQQPEPSADLAAEPAEQPADETVAEEKTAPAEEAIAEVAAETAEEAVAETVADACEEAAAEAIAEPAEEAVTEAAADACPIADSSDSWADEYGYEYEDEYSYGYESDFGDDGEYSYESEYGYRYGEMDPYGEYGPKYATQPEASEAASAETWDSQYGYDPYDDECQYDSGSSESTPAEEQVAEEQVAEEQLAEEQVAEEQLAEEQLAEEQLAEEQPAEEQPAEEQPADEQLVEERITDEQVAEDSSTVEADAIEGGEYEYGYGYEYADEYSYWQNTCDDVQMADQAETSGEPTEAYGYSDETAEEPSWDAYEYQNEYDYEYGYGYEYEYGYPGEDAAYGNPDQDSQPAAEPAVSEAVQPVDRGAVLALARMLDDAGSALKALSRQLSDLAAHEVADSSESKSVLQR